MSNRVERVLASVTDDATKAQYEDIFASDFRVSRDGTLVRIFVALGTHASSLRLSPSSGAEFGLENGASVNSGQSRMFEVLLDSGRTWNLQLTNASGAVVRHCIVQEVSA